MKIAYDAKRVFFNLSGLGNYSRETVRGVAERFSENTYHLYTPKSFKTDANIFPENVSVQIPDSLMGNLFPSIWRTRGLADQVKKDGADLFHGLSNELPQGIEKKGIPSVVTIHDLIFLRFPQYYKPIDRRVYSLKVRHVVDVADKVIAVSEQTKKDIVQYLEVPEEKVEVVYQGCDPVFGLPVAEDEMKRILVKYRLEPGFILNVGTIEERKNTLSLVKSLEVGDIKTPVVIIGRSTAYGTMVKRYVAEWQVPNVHFLHDVPKEDLPALYRAASVFVYPSLFEGFGIPILEALNASLPVITTQGGCFAEAGGPSSLYVDPKEPMAIARAINQVISDASLREEMVEDGRLHAAGFIREKNADRLMWLYKDVMERKG